MNILTPAPVYHSLGPERRQVGWLVMRMGEFTIGQGCMRLHRRAQALLSDRWSSIHSEPNGCSLSVFCPGLGVSGGRVEDLKR
jgi:hypothetical protein